MLNIHVAGRWFSLDHALDPHLCMTNEMVRLKERSSIKRMGITTFHHIQVSFDGTDQNGKNLHILL